MKKSTLLVIAMLFLIILTSCPTREFLEEQKKLAGVDLLEKYSTVQYYDCGKEKSISVPMKFDYYKGYDSIPTNQKIYLSKQELDNPNKQFLVTLKAKLSEGLKGFTINFGQPDISHANFTVVGEKEVINYKDWYWSKEEDGFAIIQFELKPAWLNCIDLRWQAAENHYLHNARTDWDCYVEEE